MARQPIIYDFKEGRAYRASEAPRKALADALLEVTRRWTRKRISKGVEGIPPHVLDQPRR